MFLPIGGHYNRSEIPIDTRSHLSYLSICGPSIICCAEVVQSALGSSGGIVLNVGVDFMCPQEEVTSESSCATILEKKTPIVANF